MKRGIKIAIVALAVIIVLAILKIFIGVSWWLLLAPIWIPVAVAYGLIVCIGVISLIGTILQRKQDKAESKIPHTCENCLFGKSSELIGEESCFGEKMGADKSKGTCEHFVLSRVDRKVTE